MKDDPAGSSIPTRDQVRVEDTWNLAALYPDDGAWEADFTRLQKEYVRILEFQGKLGSNAETLAASLECDKELSILVERLNHYSSLRSSEDSADSANLAREAKLTNLLTKIGEAGSYITPEIQAIDDATFEAFLAHPSLAEWQIVLGRIRRLKPHTLSEREERLLALSSAALSGHGETFSQLTNVDMQFGNLVDEDGNERPLSQSSFSSFLVRQNGEIRKKAFHQFYAEFDSHKFTLASSFAFSVKSDVFWARARNYPSAIEASLFHDDVPVVVYDQLIEGVRSHLPALFRYFELRRRVLKLNEIHHYDTYVPLIPEVKTDIGFDEAIGMVLDSVAPLGGEYVNALARGLREERWCDRYENKGKRSGAFSSSSYGNPPFILMNYKSDVLADVYTLAHEAGHSMHSWYSQRSQRFQDYRYPIFLAEVASTFNEQLLTHYLLEKTTDRAMRLAILNRQLDEFRGTIYRQTMFAEFEKQVHALEEQGEPLTLDVFRKVYRGLLDAYFGPDFTIDSELELECLRIPHFYHAFYVYKYATGLAAAVSLSQGVLQEGAAKVKAYLGFLKSGGSKFAIPTLREAGVDMASPEPMEKALQLFEKRVSEMEALLLA